jgi:Photosynthesis system II assembly factor YCF48/Putative zinc-finger
MCARSDQPDSREQALARLAAEALRPRSSPGQDCPDAELVAAYADQRSLGNDERAQLEDHFAGCERCQKMLAALGAGLEAPVGESVVVMPLPASVPVKSLAPSPNRWLWWLSPAFGAAAAVLLWMVLRPSAPQPVQTAADYSRAAQPETRALDALAAPRSAPEAAPAERRDAQVENRLSKVESTAKEKSATDKEVAAQSAIVADALAPQTSVTTPFVPSAVTGALDPQGAVAQALSAPAPIASSRAAAVNNQASLRVGSAAESDGAAPRQSAGNLPAGASDTVQALSLYTFVSPEGGATWRLGVGGSIEKSSDRGQIWQQQSSGVTEDLIAGSATSDMAAWVVGRGRVILRTTDGQRWERITPPAGMTGEWIAISARDAMTATASANDLRRFSTEDGGKTWTQQP